MINPPVDVLQAIGRLNSNSDFKRVLGWLDGQKTTAVESLLDQHLEHRVLHKQGYALCMHDILRTFESASVALERHANA